MHQSVSYYQIAGNRSPNAQQMEAYSQARRLQQKIQSAASEMATLDGRACDLDPRVNGVAIQDVHLASVQGKATGSASFEDGQLQSLSLQGQGENLEYSRLKGGAAAFVGKNLVVVQDKNGDLRIDNSLVAGGHRALERMRPKSAGETLTHGAARALKTGLAAAGGAIPLVGAVTNFFIGATGWSKSDSRVSLGLGGINSNLLGTAALGAKFVSIAGFSLAPLAVPVALAALGASAVCAGAASWLAGGKD